MVEVAVRNNLTSGKIDASDSPKDFWIDHVVMND
jgi:hypothetical protein